MACRGWISALFIFNLCSKVLSEIGFHGKGPKLQGGCRIQNILVQQPDFYARNPLLFIYILDVQILGPPVYRLKTERRNGAP